MPSPKMPKIDLPLDPRQADAIQDTLKLYADDGNARALADAAKRLLDRSSEARHKHPRDASMLSDLGNLALGLRDGSRN